VIYGELTFDFLMPSTLILKSLPDIGMLLLVDYFELSIASSIDS
jgi:hypothetical protein